MLSGSHDVRSHARASFAQRIDGWLAAPAVVGRVFLASAERRVTYAELDGFIRRLAGLMRERGLSGGDRVVVITDDAVVACLLSVAVLRLDLTLVLCDAQAPSAELQRLIRAAEPALVLADGATLARLGADTVRRHPAVELGPAFETALLTRAPAAPPATVDAQRVATIVFTSGTTSRPRGVMLTHGNLAAQMRIFDDVYGFDEHSRIANGLPLHHVDGLVRGPLAAAWSGAMLCRTEPFSVATAVPMLRSVAAERITHLITVPAMLRVIERVASGEQAPFAHPEFRFVLSSADVLDESLWRRFERRFDVRIANAYGLSEIVCDAVFCGPADASRRIGTLGRPHGCEIRVVTRDGRDAAAGETGVLHIRGATVTTGYFRDQEATRRALRDGWFDTGDRVVRDEDGFLHFRGRAKAEIVSRGVTIQPEPLGAALAAVDGVAEATILGVPDALRGERVVACVVSDASPRLSSEDVLAMCRELFSPELRPTDAFVLDALPRGPAGKVRLGELARMAAELIEARDAATEGTVDPYAIAAECFGADRATLDGASTPFNTGGWDSLAHLSFITRLERALGATLSPIEIMDLVSLADAEKIVARHSGAARTDAK